MYLRDERFSLWLDFIERDFLDNEFLQLIKDGTINGATSNPAIFKNAILTSNAYKNQLSTLENMSPKERYEAIAIEDIKKAAKILLPLYESGDDGFVSIEVDPFLCDDADATIAEGERLFKQIGYPNVMIKIPATEAGYIAMRELSSKNIPINATLIFTLEQAMKCAEALKDSQNIGVISIFVSRLDRVLDDKLSIKGRAGIVNAATIYSEIEKLGYGHIRALFASTGVKADSYRASYYIDELLAKNSINTAPLATIKSFIENGDCTIKLPLAETLDEIVGDIDIKMYFKMLIDDGLEQFKEAFGEILKELED